MWNYKACNKIVGEQLLTKEKQLHHNRLKNIKSVIKIKKPTHYHFLDFQQKYAKVKKANQFERKMQNNSLIQKFKHIYNRKQQSVEKVDELTKSSCCMRSISRTTLSQTLRIKTQNKKFLERLITIQSNYKKLHSENQILQDLSKQKRPLSVQSSFKHLPTLSPQVNTFENTSPIPEKTKKKKQKSTNKKKYNIDIIPTRALQGKPIILVTQT